jgi:hypothetical protein
MKKDAVSRLVEEFEKLTNAHPYFALEIGWNKTVDWMVTVSKRVSADNKLGYEWKTIIQKQDVSCNKACSFVIRRLKPILRP